MHWKLSQIAAFMRRWALALFRMASCAISFFSCNDGTKNALPQPLRSQKYRHPTRRNNYVKLYAVNRWAMAARARIENMMACIRIAQIVHFFAVRIFLLATGEASEIIRIIGQKIICFCLMHYILLPSYSAVTQKQLYLQVIRICYNGFDWIHYMDFNIYI